MLGEMLRTWDATWHEYEPMGRAEYFGLTDGNEGSSAPADSDGRPLGACRSSLARAMGTMRWVASTRGGVVRGVTCFGVSSAALF